LTLGQAEIVGLEVGDSGTSGRIPEHGTGTEFFDFEPFDFETFDFEEFFAEQ